MREVHEFHPNFGKPRIKCYGKNHDKLLYTNQFVLMRTTGLIDNNDDPIYYGDIIRFRFDDNRNDGAEWGGTARVTETMGYGAGLIFDYKDEMDDVYAVLSGGQIEDIWDDYDMWDLEIIGNAYENPELMK